MQTWSKACEQWHLSCPANLEHVFPCVSWLRAKLWRMVIVEYRSSRTNVVRSSRKLGHDLRRGSIPTPNSFLFFLFFPFTIERSRYSFDRSTLFAIGIVLPTKDKQVRIARETVRRKKLIDYTR